MSGSGVSLGSMLRPLQSSLWTQDRPRKLELDDLRHYRLTRVPSWFNLPLAAAFHEQEYTIGYA